MPSFAIRGPSASVHWGYHSAARLGAWTITASDMGGELTAKVESADTFKLSQPALTFRVPRPNGSVWKWPILSLQYADGRLSARLGPQE